MPIQIPSKRYREEILRNPPFPKEGAQAAAIVKTLQLLAVGTLIGPMPYAIAGETPSWFPADPSCQILEAPADAGAVATPGGFMLVYPRNDRIAQDYSGCKTLWIYDDPQVPRRWATLRFAGGQLARAVVWRRDAQEIADRVCDRPASAQAPECSGVDDNEMTSLRLPSWPRVCMTEPDLGECGQAPR